MISPHELFAEVFRKYPTQFEHRFGAQVGKLKLFWDQVLSSERGRQWYESQPALQAVPNLHHIIPLVFHLDAAHFSKKQSAMGWSFSSVVGSGSEKESIFLIASWIKSKHSPIHHLAEVIWPNVKASFDALLTCRYPTHNLDGTVFEAGSWRDQCKGEAGGFGTCFFWGEG